LARFLDPDFVNILMDDNFIVLAHSDAIKKIFLATSNAPIGFVESRAVMHDLFPGSESFEYLVLPVDPSTGVTPRLMVSSVPPHLSISLCVDKVFKRWGYGEFAALGSSIIKLVADSSPTGATFKPNSHTFIFLRYIHERWATRHIPPRFLGIEEDSNSDSDEESAEGSSTMEWEVCTIASEDDEPQRRLLPHELGADPVPKFRPVSHADEDDAISYDSHITGVEDPEEFYQASLARGVYETDPSWSKGIQSWAESALGVDDEKMLLNDGQIEEDPGEQPRFAASVDLDKPDYLSRQTATR